MDILRTEAEKNPLIPCFLRTALDFCSMSLCACSLAADLEVYQIGPQRWNLLQNMCHILGSKYISYISVASNWMGQLCSGQLLHRMVLHNYINMTYIYMTVYKVWGRHSKQFGHTNQCQLTYKLCVRCELLTPSWLYIVTIIDSFLLKMYLWRKCMQEESRRRWCMRGSKELMASCSVRLQV